MPYKANSKYDIHFDDFVKTIVKENGTKVEMALYLQNQEILNLLRELVNDEREYSFDISMNDFDFNSALDKVLHNVPNYGEVTISFETEKDISLFFREANRTIIEYGYVSVYDISCLLGLKDISECQMDKEYGWRNIDIVKIDVNSLTGNLKKYTITLEKPVKIDS